MEDFQKQSTAPPTDNTEQKTATSGGSPTPGLNEEIRTLSGEELKLVGGGMLRQHSAERTTGSR
jgi:hypothetical protein